MFYLDISCFTNQCDFKPHFCSQLVMIAVTPSGRNVVLEYDQSWFKDNFQIVTYALYGVWNLDFLRYSLPAFCVSDKLSTTKIALLAY